MDTQSERAIRQLFEVYSIAFDRSDAEAKPLRIASGYAGTEFEPKKLDAHNFEVSLFREWRTPSLKAAWLLTFLSADSEVLKKIPSNLRDRLVAEMTTVSLFRRAS